MQLEAPYVPHFVEGWPGWGEYHREIPDRFSQDTDDIFMRSMIKNYALERQTCAPDCQPDGTFWLNESAAKDAAREVLGTHKDMGDAELSAYLKKYWSKAWGHFDVNRSGYIEVLKAPQLMRFLASDQRLDLHVSG